MTSARYATGLAALQRLGGPDIAEPVLAAGDIAPDIVRFAIEFAFGEVLARPGLPLVTQELCTVAALAALEHPVSQLAWHRGAALHVGASSAAVDDACRLAAACAGRVEQAQAGAATASLDDATRALVRVAALTAHGRAPDTLRVAIAEALSSGVSRQTIVQVLEQMAVYAGFPAALNGIAAARSVFREADAATG